MSPSFAIQKFVHARLIADPAVTTLVPAAHITDRHGRPARFPSITFGEGREYPLSGVKLDSSRVSLDLHIWTDTPGTRDAKQLVDKVRRVLRFDQLLGANVDGHTLLDLRFEGARYLPDPSSTDITHAVLMLDAFMLETA